MKFQIRRIISATALLALIATLPSAYAANYTWVPAGAGTWDTIANNWNDGVTNPTPWVNGNTAIFGGTVGYTVTVASAITAIELRSTATATIVLSGNSIDVPLITTGTGAFDVTTKLTGNHGLTYTTTGAGRLNLKVAADYTGDTFVTGSGYLLSDNVLTNALPVTTTLNLATGTTYQVNKTGGSQELAGLVSTTTGAGLVSQRTSSVYTITLNTKASTTTTFSGTISSQNGTSSMPLALVVTGSGTQALNGTNTFFGTVAVNGNGTLSFGSNLVNASSVTVGGGTLKSSVANVNLGAGTVTLNSGTINPGDTGTIGSFTVATNQSFTATGGDLRFDLANTTFDKIISSGTSTFSLSNTTLTLNLLSGFNYANSYAVFQSFAGGTISNLTITGYDTTNYIASLSNAGVLSFSASAVPEPSTYALLGGVAALGFVVIRRRLAKRV